MKRIQLIVVAIFIVCLSSVNSYAQKKNIKVTLNPIKFDYDVSYFIDTVVDLRVIKDVIGYGHVGMFNRKVPVVFAHSFQRQVNQFLKTSFPFEENKIPLVIHVKNIYVNEIIRAFSEKGIAEVEIEIFKKVDGKLFSYGSYNENVKRGGLDVSLSHNKRIEDAFKMCFKSFRISKWKTREPQLVVEDSLISSLSYVINECPNKGVYKSFNDILSKNPDTSMNVFFKRDPSSSELERYHLLKDTIDMVKMNGYFGFSDGEFFYLHSSNYKIVSNHYIKSQLTGRYMFFEDRFSNQVAGAAFGLLGSLASNITRPIIMDSRTGISFELTESKMNEILTLYPDLKKKYDKSKAKSTALKKMAIGVINELEQMEHTKKAPQN